MALVICMASVKGGSGKTTLSATFAAVLAAMGKRVLLVDTDAATNGLSLLYLDETLAERDRAQLEDEPPVVGAYELDRFPHGFVPLPTGALLLPASVGFFNTEDIPPDPYAARLRAGVEAWRADFDFIVLDAQAGSDVYAAISMSVADRVVIVGEYDPLSAAGVERLKALYPKELSYERTWVLLNKMLPELVQSYSDFMEVARYLRPIPWDAAVVRAYSRRSLALDLTHGNEHTAAVIGTLRSLLPPKDERELSEWLKTRAAEIREPLDVRVRDLEMEIASLDGLRGRESTLTRLGVYATSLAVLVVAIVMLFALVLPDAIAVVTTGSALALVLSAAVTVLGYRRGHSVELVGQRARLREQLDRLRVLAELQDEHLFSEALPVARKVMDRHR
jgi:septum site-determining protein MinD